MKKISITILTIFLVFAYGHAQDYNTGIGLRGGFDNGITIKHFISEKAAFEGIISSRWRGLEITGLYELHGRAFDTDRLNWYAGFGVILDSMMEIIPDGVMTELIL